jgi:hypothetical protein
VTIQVLVDVDTAASGDDKLTYQFLADAITMTDDEHPLLAVDLYTEPRSYVPAAAPLVRRRVRQPDHREHGFRRVGRCHGRIRRVRGFDGE